MKTRYLWIAVSVPAVMAFAVLAGCGPATEEEIAYSKSQEGRQQQREHLQQILEGGTEESVAIRMAKTAPAPEGGGNCDRWVAHQTHVAPGNVMFPRWEAKHNGVERLQVQYTFTLMDENGGATKKGYAWTVDLMQKTVSAPREMTAVELGLERDSHLPRKQIEKLNVE
jgi:predicted transcriptional regulator